MMTSPKTDGKNGKKTRECRALALVMQWIRANGTSALARKLDCSWEHAKRISSGESRPTIDEVMTIREVCGVPVEAWRTRQ